MSGVLHPLAGLAEHPAVSIAVTVLAYAAAVWLHRRWRSIPPIVAAAVPVAAFLLLVKEPFARYNLGADVFTWLLGPATVALAVPMYRRSKFLAPLLPRLTFVVFSGSLVGMVTAGLTAWLLGASMPVVMSTVPKSVTTPIAIAVSRELHGIPQITVALVVLAGIMGASFGKPLLRLAGVNSNTAIGAAIGTVSHGVGTASLVSASEAQAAVSSWAMAAAGIFVSLLATLLVLFLRWF